jgi:hypothetical protein
MFSSVNVYSPKYVEKSAEFYSALFLLTNGIPIHSARKSSLNRSPDHICVHKQTAFETSVLHSYTPQEVQHLQETIGKVLGKDTLVSVYGDENYHIKTLVLREARCENNVAIVRTVYDASSYAKKIYNKIDEEYKQIRSFEKGVLMIYHMTCPFDPLSLGAVYSQILSDKGTDYPKLTGILVALPSNSFLPLGIPSYFFMENPHSQLYPPSELERVWMIPKSETLIHPISYHTFLRAKRGWNRVTYPAPHF